MVSVTAIVPGYVDTARLRELNGGNAGHKPFLLSEEEAAAMTRAPSCLATSERSMPRADSSA